VLSKWRLYIWSNWQFSGVHGIFHTASPITFSLDSYDETVTPALRGSETLLKSALKAGPNLTSVVVTSSVVAIINPTEDLGHVYTEAEFAFFALEQAIKDKSNGVKSTGGTLYAASKITADRAVWKFREDHKPAFSISSIVGFAHLTTPNSVCIFRQLTKFI